MPMIPLPLTFRCRGYSLALILFLAVAAVGQRVPAKAGPWLSPLRVNAAGARDPLQVFQAWRRQNHVTVPATPAVWKAHVAWLRRQGKPLRPIRQQQARPRPEAAGNSQLPGVTSSGNLFPLQGINDYQGEVAVAVNPGNPRQMAAGSNTWLSDPNCNGVTQTLLGSSDGGETWTYQCAPVPSGLLGSKSTPPLFGSDPSLAWDAQGNVYASYMLLGLGLDPTVPESGTVLTTTIVVARSSDDGATWTPLGPVVNHLTDARHFDDKDMMTVDTGGGAHSHPNRLYVIWDENNTELAAWSDDGATWSTATLEDAAHTGQDIGGDLAVGPDGTVYAIWTRFAGVPGAGAGGDRIVFAKSTDGGNTWSAPVRIAAGMLSISSSNTFIPAQDQRGINTFGSITVDTSSSPYAGSLYVVYADTPASAGPAGNINIYMVRSADGGATWSQPRQVNDDSGQAATHFFPWCAVDPSTGILSVDWYDTRNDPDQLRTQIFYAQSTDGGASFQPNLQISQPSSGLPNPSSGYSDEDSLENAAFNPNQYGDYAMISAAGGTVLMGWTDTRQFYPQDQMNPLTEDLAINVLKVTTPLTYSISGRVTDAGGQGLPGINISAGPVSTVTAGDGRYTLPGLGNGSYSVTASDPNFSFSPSGQTITIQNNLVAGVNFTATATAPVFSISGSVTLNGQGLAGVTVNAGTATTVTDAQGQYTLAGLAAGQYAVTASDVLYVPSPSLQPVTLSGADATGVNFIVPTWSISGTVTGTVFGGAMSQPALGGLAGTTIEAGGRTTTSDANGRFVLSELPAGTYNVTATHPGFWILPTFWAGVDTPISLITLTDADRGNVDFSGRAMGENEIDGTVTLNGTGLSGVTVSDGHFFAVTDNSGQYRLFEIQAGAYTLTPAKTGLQFQPSSETVTTASSGSIATAGAFTAVPSSPLYNLSGNVRADGKPVKGAAIAADLSSAISDAQGNYTISGLTPGEVQVESAAAGDVFNPVWQPEHVGSGDVTGVNFTGNAATFSISGATRNADGSPIAGAAINAFQNGGGLTPYKTTSDSSGNYVLKNLPPYGDNNEGYVLTATKSGLLFSPPAAILPLTNSDISGADFTASPAQTVSGTVTGPDGKGVSNIFISTDEAVFAPPVATDANGHYQLTLSAGSHVVTPATGWYTNYLNIFSPMSARVSVGATPVTGVDFTEIQTYTVSGEVLSGATGVAGVKVHLIHDPVNEPGGTVVATTTTDAHGDFAFQNVPKSEYIIVPQIPGHGLRPADIYQQLYGDVRGLTFSVVPGTTLSGTITLNGQGVGEVPVLILYYNSSYYMSTVFGGYTDDSGNFTASLPYGHYKVIPGGAQYFFHPASADATLKDSAVTGVDFSAIVPTLNMSVAHNHYTVNSSVASINDPVSISSNVTNPVQLGCILWICGVTPSSVSAPGTATLLIDALDQNPSTDLTVTVQGTLGPAHASQTITVHRQSITLSIPTTSATVKAGETATYKMSVSPVNQYTGTVQLTCSASLPQYACGIDPASVDMSSGNAADAVISVNTKPAQTSRILLPLRLGRSDPGRWTPAQWLGAIVLLAAFAEFLRRRRGHSRWPLAVSAFLLLLAFSGCGGGGGTPSSGSSPPPPPPTITNTQVIVMVVANADGLITEQRLNLTVQSSN